MWLFSFLPLSSSSKFTTIIILILFCVYSLSKITYDPALSAITYAKAICVLFETDDPNNKQNTKKSAQNNEQNNDSNNKQNNENNKQNNENNEINKNNSGFKKLLESRVGVSLKSSQNTETDTDRQTTSSSGISKITF